ncbi:site-specific DNA-methyltransferase, partial [Candidatus Poribacteria bacterium]|nr:site-specific DNA-methyltransferase [Candidatus Poribacteria bacterium]
MSEAPDPLDGADWKVVNGDALEILRGLPDGCADLVLTDPPYFKVKDDDWDRQWETGGKFIAWLATIADEWRRVLKPNGSLYVFASPQMAARVEVMLAERFAVLNHIAWAKPTGRHSGVEQKALRAYFPQTERIIFCEQRGSDLIAKGESQWINKCDE